MKYYTKKDKNLYFAVAREDRILSILKNVKDKHDRGTIYWCNPDHFKKELDNGSFDEITKEEFNTIYKRVYKSFPSVKS